MNDYNKKKSYILFMHSQLLRSLEKTYVISSKSVNDVNKLNRSLGLVRSLLKVQVAPDEEEQLKTSIWYLVVILFLKNLKTYF